MGCKVIRSFIGVLFCLLLASRAWADGAVYAMTNALGNNQILVYHRASDGSLSSTPSQTIATGGGGSGLQLSGVDSLGSAGSLQLDAAHHFLFAINTESASQNNGAGTYNTDCAQGTITSFLVAADGTLTFADRVFSRGLFPNSLAIAQPENQPGKGGKGKGGKGNTNSGLGDVLYVLNAGGPEPPAVCSVMPATANGPNIAGFSVDGAGNMIPLDSTQPIDPGPSSAASGVSCLAATAAGFEALTGAPEADFFCGLNPPSFARSPAQVRFTPDGNQLVVTVKGTNTIYVFPVDANGRAGNPTTTQALGPALPSFFGVTFDTNANLLVTELFGTATSIPAGGQGALSSFALNTAGDLVSISSDVGDGGTAACWIALEPVTGKFAYVSNNLSASISSYSVASNGAVTLLAGNAAPSSGPNDLATATENGASFLYVVEVGSGMVGAFQINLTNGGLIPLSAAGGVPTTGAQGLAAF